MWPFKTRVYLHPCTADVGAGMSKWQADWPNQAYSVTTDEGTMYTKSVVLDSLGAILAEQGIKRYKVIETYRCSRLCRPL